MCDLWCNPIQSYAIHAIHVTLLFSSLTIAFAYALYPRIFAPNPILIPFVKNKRIVKIQRICSECEQMNAQATIELIFFYQTLFPVRSFVRFKS